MANKPTCLSIKNFREFQHYHTRGAPWIKLYASLLSDPAFLQLPEAAQAQLMKLWLLASQFGHPLPNNPRLLAGRIGTTGRFFLSALIDAGFLIPCNDPASTDASNGASRNASTPASADASTNGENASSYVRASARVPESTDTRELRGERTEQPVSVAAAGDFARELSIAANRGLAEHETRPQPIPRIIATSGRSHTAAEEFIAGGIPLEFAIAQVYRIAKSHDAEGEITSLKYFVAPSLRAWKQHAAKSESDDWSPPADGQPVPANGSHATNGRREPMGPGERTYRNAKAALEGL
jgi:hypothetical protein